jgi:hypothetical protein
MSESPLTLLQLFSATEHGLGRNEMAAAALNMPIGPLKKEVQKHVGGVSWDVIVEEAWGKLPELLNIKLADVICGGWNKLRDLAKYTDGDKYPPDQVVLVQLAEHTVSSVHHPYVEILVNGQPRGRIVFDLSVDLTLKGVVLKIQDAKIMAVKSGSCQARGSLAFEKAVLAEGTLGPFDLPGEMDLGNGLSLR